MIVQLVTLADRMPEKWTIRGEPFGYEGGADPSADVDRGFRIDLVDADGRETKVNVERVIGSEASLTAEDARRAVRKYLDQDDPPPRIVLTRDGSFVVPAT